MQYAGTLGFNKRRFAINGVSGEKKKKICHNTVKTDPSFHLKKKKKRDFGCMVTVIKNTHNAFSWQNQSKLLAHSNTYLITYCLVLLYFTIRIYNLQFYLQ